MICLSSSFYILSVLKFDKQRRFKDDGNPECHTFKILYVIHDSFGPRTLPSLLQASLAVPAGICLVIMSPNDNNFSAYICSLSIHDRRLQPLGWLPEFQIYPAFLIKILATNYKNPIITPDK